MKQRKLHIALIALVSLFSIHGTVGEPAVTTVTGVTTVEGEIDHGLTVFDVYGQPGMVYDLSDAKANGNTLMMSLEDPTQPALMVIKAR